VLKGIFGLERKEVTFHNEELHILYYLSIIIKKNAKEIKRWVEHIARIKLTKTAFYGTRKCIAAFKTAFPPNLF
jgi:hypothetical protein